MDSEKIGFELRSLSNMVRRYFKSCSSRKEIDKITANNGWIIAYLGENADKDIFQKDIEEHFTITSSTASKVLSLMEQKGLIERQAVSQDARLKKIALTQKAWELRGIMVDDAKKMERTLTKGFTEDEAEILLSYLKRMKDNISKAQEKDRGGLYD